jgi:hypothetical protein
MPAHPAPIRAGTGKVDRRSSRQLSGWTAADNASVAEHEPPHGAILQKEVRPHGSDAGKRCNEVGLISLMKAGTRCYKLADMLLPG